MRINLVFAINDEKIYVEYDKVCHVVRKGADFYEKIWIEPVTGMERRSVVDIKDTKEVFYKQLLRDLRTENVTRQLEKTPPHNLTKVRIGTVIMFSKIEPLSIKHMTNRIIKNVEEMLGV